MLRKQRPIRVLTRPRVRGADGVVPSDERSQILLAVATRAKRQRSRSSFLPPPEGLLVYSVFVSELKVTVLLELDETSAGRLLSQHAQIPSWFSKPS